MTNEEAIKRLEKIRAIYLGMDNKSDVKALNMAIKALSAENTAEWIDYSEDDLRISYYRCSKCGYWMDDKTKYCQNCGAKMEGVEE